MVVEPTGRMKPKTAMETKTAESSEKENNHRPRRLAVAGGGGSADPFPAD